MLFSATQTTKVSDLARISLRPGPLYINVDHATQHSTVEGLYVVILPDPLYMTPLHSIHHQRELASK